jgi:uncharacterized membrane protein
METPQHNRNRETMLALAMLFMLGGAFFFFVTSIFGVIFNVFVLMVAIAAIGYLHYYLWGHGMSQQTAGEREEEQLRQRLEAEDLYEPPPHQRF